VELGAFGPVRSIGNTVRLSEQTAAGKMGIISQFALDSDQLQGMTNRQRAFVFRGETAQNRNNLKLTFEKKFSSMFSA